jgi:hypothetical protein
MAEKNDGDQPPSELGFDPVKAKTELLKVKHLPSGYALVKLPSWDESKLIRIDGDDVQ